jgi:hypothetical protein
MRRKSKTRTVLLAAIATAGAWSRAGAGMGKMHEAQPAPPNALPPSGFGVGILAVEPLEMGEPVENEPYSAEIVNEVRQHLPDGNRIERRTTGMVARDSRGRIRREQQLAAIGPFVPEGDARMVTITDPVARVHYSLDPVRRLAVRSRPGRPAPALSEGPLRPVPSDGLGPRLTIQARRGSEPPGDTPAAADVQTEQLGTKSFDGVRSEGTRSVMTLPPGAIGNLRAIEVVSERWYSPELRVVVFSRRTDPRFGETIYRLTNITRTEPEAALFQVPADYKQEEATASPGRSPGTPIRTRPLQ